MSRTEKVYRPALAGKKVPILTLDGKWYQLFRNVGMTAEISQKADELNALLRRQGKINTESRQIKAIKKVAGTLKLAYSQYKELQSFAQFGSDLDEDTKSRLAKGERIVEVLKQPNSSPVPVEKQVMIMYAVNNNYLKDIAKSDIREFEMELYSYMDEVRPEIAKSILETKDLTKENEEKLKDAIVECVKKFNETR